MNFEGNNEDLENKRRGFLLNVKTDQSLDYLMATEILNNDYKCFKLEGKDITAINPNI